MKANPNLAPVFSWTVLGGPSFAFYHDTRTALEGGTCYRLIRQDTPNAIPIIVGNFTHAQYQHKVAVVIERTDVSIT